jgi:hypothetical protein
MAKKVNKTQNTDGIISLGLIIPLCIFIAPVGVMLQASRQKKIHKLDLFRAGRNMLILAGVFLLLFFILISDSTTTDNPFTYMFLFGGLLGAISGIILIKDSIFYGNIKTAIENQGLRSISEIAIAVGTADHATMKAVTIMLRDGYLPDFEIDMKTSSLRQTEAVMVKIMAESRAAECIYCGAKVTLFKDKVNKCEYCGSSLNYEE